MATTNKKRWRQIKEENFLIKLYNKKIEIIY